MRFHCTDKDDTLKHVHLPIKILEFSVHVVTLGARGFCCAVSGVGHISIVTRLRRSCRRPSAADAKRRIFVRRAKEETSGTQGNM